MKKFNINNYVEFKLTDEGVKILKGYYDQIDKSLFKIFRAKGFREVPNDNGRIKMQFWYAMMIFSPYFMNCGENIFKNNDIYFNEKELKNIALINCKDGLNDQKKEILAKINLLLKLKDVDEKELKDIILICLESLQFELFELLKK